MGGIAKKITLYVDEKELEAFDKALPQDSKRSSIFRYLMRDFINLRFHNLAHGIIIAKPSGTSDSFLIQINAAYYTAGYITSSNSIVKISKDEILKHNLDLGDTVKLVSEEAKAE